jgi:radical SAM protein with 4Fe4S-binding SPASM domain
MKSIQSLAYYYITSVKKGLFLETSRYVFKSGETLYNSMTNDRVDIGSSEEELRDKLFLAGQERQSLEARLFAKPKRLTVKIIPTWECNLRCKHCSVLHRLKKRDDFCIDPSDVVRFMESFKSHYGLNKFSLLFIGGECLLRSKECLAIADAVSSAIGKENVMISLTTNLSLNLNVDAVRLLSMTKAFDISLDGTEFQHNWQRKFNAPGSDINPFRKTFFNIMRLLKLGLKDKIKVQAAIQDAMSDENEKIKFFESLVRIGVSFENITYGGVHPTIKNPKVDQTYLDHLKSTTFWRIPCCDYRYMAHFSFNPDGSMDNDYFGNISEKSELNISDFGRSYGIEELEAAYRHKIEKNMNIMNDEVCLKKCPVLAYCWGRCHNNSMAVNNPSAHCDMAGLEKAVKESFSGGNGHKIQDRGHIIQKK